MAATQESQPIIPLLDPVHDPGNTPAADASANMSDDKMKAVHYEGPFKVSVKEIGLPKIQHPDDVIVKVTTAAICGSDLHMYVYTQFCKQLVLTECTGTKGAQRQKQDWFSDTKTWESWWKPVQA